VLQRSCSSLRSHVLFPARQEEFRMNVGQLCQREVVTTRAGEELTAASQEMRARHVGFLVVVEPAAAPGRLRVVGVLTDRDIVVAVLARDIDTRALKVGDVMSREPLLAEESQPVESVLCLMREVGVRRVPVVDRDGLLVGVLSLDDVLEAMAEQLVNIAASIRSERRVERVLRQ
jgi:CBS domain-containing protein